MTSLAFTVRPPLPPGVYAVITHPAVITCGDCAVAATYDRALAQRIAELLNQHGLALPVGETEMWR